MFGLRSNRFHVDLRTLQARVPNADRLKNKDGIVYTEDDVPVYTLYLGNIPSRSSEHQLKTYFSRFGVVDSLHIIRKNKATDGDRPYRYGFVQFQKAECAAKVLSTNHASFSKKLKVKSADTWKQPKYARDMKKVSDGNSSHVENRQIVNDTTDADGKLTVMALNDDCLRHIFSFLDQSDIYKQSFVCQRFYDIVDDIVKVNKTFDFNDINSDLQSNFTLMETRRILSNFGEHVKSLRMRGCGDYRRHLEFVAIYCQLLESIHFFLLRGVHAETYKRTLQTNREHLKSLTIEDCDLSDKMCKQFGCLPQLKTLNLSRNSDITGKYLKTLTNIEDLNLSKCECLEAHHFIEMCKVMKLKTLNILGCYQLNGETFKALVETQTDLENLSIGTSYHALTLEEIANLKSLKHIRIYGESCAMRSTSDSLLRELAKTRNETIESLELYFIPFLSEESNRECILKFSNLKKLSIVRDRYINDAFVLDISKACPKLEEVNLSDSTCIGDVGILDLVQNLKHLKMLDLTDHSHLDAAIVLQIYSILEKRQNEQREPISKLTLNIINTSINEEEHENCRDLIKFSKQVDLNYENFDEMSDESYSDVFDHFHDFMDYDTSDNEIYEDYFDDDEDDYLANVIFFL